MLRRLANVLGAKPGERKFIFPCPLCQNTETPERDWKGEIRPGKVQVAMISCRRCGPEMARMLALKGEVSVSFLKKGTTKEIEKAWQEVLGESFRSSSGGEIDLDLLHRVYSEMFSSGELKRDHVIWLKERGFPLRISEAIGYFSWPLSERAIASLYDTYKEKLFTVPGFYSRTGEVEVNTSSSSAIAFPCRDHEGKIRSIRLRYPYAKREKYRVLTSVPYGPAGLSLCHFPLRRDGYSQARSVRVVEGERKADYCTQWDPAGIHTVSIPGTVGVQVFVRELPNLPKLETVVIAMDQDEAGRQAAIKLAMALVDRVDVTCEVWDEAYKGIDDAMLAGVDRVLISDDSWLGEEV